ncbi:hypothetical protein KR067_011385 [Drosophila pandora]|nr:hypothetical protein KR067_011385 [Drosophila pandora]
MVYMENWRMIMFLGTPVMPDLTSLITTGLYINDLSMHDFSRDLMLAGTQQSVELKLALDQEQQKSKKLEESMRLVRKLNNNLDEFLHSLHLSWMKKCVERMNSYIK